MNPFLLTGLIVLAVVATAQHFIGTKQNRVISSRMAGGVEKALHPTMTNYVNIGGTIGHNFTFALRAPWTNAKGTITLSPRQSLLYLPFSRLIGIRDRFFLNLFTKKKLRGEAHIIDSHYLKKARIEGIEKMERREIGAGGRRFILLWRGSDLSDELSKVLAALPDPGRLHHFCSFADNKTFFIYLSPREGQVQEDLEAILPRLSLFFEGGKEQ